MYSRDAHGHIVRTGRPCAKCPTITPAQQVLVTMHALDNQTRRTVESLRKLGHGDPRVESARVELLAHTRAARALARRWDDARDPYSARVLEIAVTDAVDLASDRAAWILAFAHNVLAAV